MSSKTTTASVRFEDGAGAFIECAIAGGARWHTYFGKPDAWLCSHCGALARPETPPEIPRPSEREEQFRPPVQPVGVRERLQDGSSQVLPLPAEVCEVIVAPVGAFEWVIPQFNEKTRHAIVRRPLHELANLTAVYNTKEKS
jgi:hypothetical protein